MMNGLEVGGPGSIEMGNETKRRATYADIEALPENMVGQIIDGELIAMSRPASPHAVAHFAIGGLLFTTFQAGQRAPGGWWILNEPELHFGEDVLVPDIAGWRSERMPQMRRVPFFTLAPDWVCEVLSPSTATLDRKRKREIYAREGVEYVWLVDPALRTLEVFRRHEGQWIQRGTYSGEARIRAEPFEVLELDLGLLWPPELEAP
ncbi:Uma2 family endonuclease [Pyxidicoccus sp. MSG2]|uniref:Uma2 family endonuclease n=1 Tax=Pyxidicoccus sp. MSG2 TaxID=2996790 RepID=UPI00226D7AA4|nr:Uma2 family endonuclease [Pyxidicoccus sp. MSG2]MCY1016226.1 Uma2 family endonuclease [Pyxidicoccus sp. MSG2]